MALAIQSRVGIRKCGCRRGVVRALDGVARRRLRSCGATAHCTRLPHLWWKTIACSTTHDEAFITQRGAHKISGRFVAANRRNKCRGGSLTVSDTGPVRRRCCAMDDRRRWRIKVCAVASILRRVRRRENYTISRFIVSVDENGDRLWLFGKK